MELDEQIEQIAATFHEDPKNKVFANEKLLLASVLEENGNEISSENLVTIVKSYEDGNLSETDEELYDAAVYCCSVLARKCFAEDPEDEDEEVDFNLTWLHEDDGSVSAEIRPALHHNSSRFSSISDTKY